MKEGAIGAELKPTRTDLPLKVGETRIVILKDLPVVQCANCPEYLLEDGVLQRVDEILAGVEQGAELEIIGYAAWDVAAYRRTAGFGCRTAERPAPDPERYADCEAL